MALAEDVHLLRFERPPAGWALALLALAGAGCGDDPQSAGLELLTPRPNQVLTLEDDTDETRTGLQFKVTGSSHGLGQGTTVSLFLDDEQRAQSVEVDGRGEIDFGDVTLPPGEHEIRLETLTGSSSSDPEQQYTFKALLIRSPESNARLSSEDDEDQSEDELQISVRVEAFAFGAERVSLLVDEEELAGVTLDSDGFATFAGVTLHEGPHSLVARADSAPMIESPPVVLEVRKEACATAQFLAPVLPARGGRRLVLGGPSSCPADMKPFTTSVVLATDAADGRSAYLLVNGEPAGEAMVDAGTIVFDGVQLPGGNRGIRIAVELASVDGTRCPTELPADVYIDCDGPPCTIARPTPLVVGETLYLNAAMRGPRGFDVVVETDAELSARDVQLVIDGRDDDVSGMTTRADGRTRAAFGQLELADGEHTIEALCTDDAGNVGSSGELTWLVDTTPCAVTVSDPMDATVFVPDDDEDSASLGMQVVVTSEVTGDDCVAQRTRVCDPAVGINAGDFIAYGGSSPLLSSVRLDDGALEQSLCVQVQDRAGNNAQDSVPVRYQRQAPAVKIESPADGARVNFAGGSGVLADAAPGTPQCDAAFSIACSLGRPVQLRHGGPSGAVIASADCLAPQSGDPALPAAYDGRARLVASFEDGDGMATVVATQTIAGSSTQTLVGASAAVDLNGDCTRPVASLIGDPCNLANGGVLRVNNVNDTFSQDVVVRLAEPGLGALTLGVDNAGSSTVASPDGSAAGDHLFAAVQFGGVGTVVLTASVSDAAGNIGTASCTAQISTP